MKAWLSKQALYRWFHLSNALVGITGLVYAVMLYFLKPSDPFALANHPWQPHFHKMHVLFAPLLVFIIGWFWHSHAGWFLKNKKKEGKKTGVVILWAALPMIFSGYLLQTSVSPLWRDIWMWVHLATSAVWMIGFGGHYLAHWLVRKKTG